MRAMYTSTVTGLVPAPRDVVYRALLDPDAVARWRVPDGMRGEVHELEPRVGGRIRMSLTYDDPASAGKSGGAAARGEDIGAMAEPPAEVALEA